MPAIRILAPFLIVLTVGLIWFIFVAEPFSRWLAQRRAAHNGAVIGHVEHAEGSVRRIHGANIDIVTNGMELRDGDRLQSSVESKAEFFLNSQDEFDLPSGAVVQLRLWNPLDASSPVYLESTLGDLNLLKAGARGKAYVVKDGRLYLPGQKPSHKPMALTVLKSAPLDMHLAETDVAAIDEASPDGQSGSADAGSNAATAPQSSTAGANMAKSGAGGTSIGAGDELLPVTLSNEYIDQVISNHQGQLQKCWVSRLKDAPNLKGQVVLQFEISARGKVKDARIADSDIQDDTLRKCVVSVFERMAFSSFKGAEISLSYPVKFE